MAVYTEVSDEALRAFLAGYDLGGLLAYRGIAEGVENSNYALRTEAGDFVLTLYEKRVDPRELPYFLGLMEHLAIRGLACPTPVRGRDGQALRELCGRPAAICTFLEGVWPRRVRPEHLAPLGEALGRLHAASADFAMARPNALGPAGWAPLLAGCRDRGDEVQAGLVAELDERLGGILAAWPAPGALPVGQIHADLFPDNVFFLADQAGQPVVSGLIDFYFACTDLLAYDVAVCLNAWCFEADGGYNVTKAAALVRGYQAVRPLLRAEREAMPVLCRGAAIRFLLTRLYDWTHTPADALVTRKDPLEYLKKLRFFAQAETPGALGL